MSSDLKDLLDLLEEHSDVPGSEIEHFIKDLNIQSHHKCTYTYVIYWCYLKWKIKTGGVPIPRNVFFKEFRKYFKPASLGQWQRYYVKADEFLLHPDELEDARKECKRELVWHAKRRGGRTYSPKRNRSEYIKIARRVRLEKKEKRKKGI